MNIFRAIRNWFTKCQHTAFHDTEYGDECMDCGVVITFTGNTVVDAKTATGEGRLTISGRDAASLAPAFVAMGFDVTVKP